ERRARAGPWAGGRAHDRKYGRVPAVRLESLGGPDAHTPARRPVGLAATHPRQPARPPADRRHAHGAWWRRDGFPHVALRGEPDQRGAGLLLGGPTGRDRPRRRGGPAGCSRVLVPVVQGGTAWAVALYLADSWRTGGLQLTYGARLESARFSGAPPYNRAVDSLFALRTDRIPGHSRLSPRIGFLWTGGGGEGGSPTILRGGVGDFQSPTPTALHAAAPGAPGLANAETELICVGSAVPT